jgi:hypothetical protein
VIVTAEPVPQLSVAVTNELFTTGTALAQETVASAGKTVIVGAVVLLTVIICVLLDELPQVSVATYVRETVNLLTQLLDEITSAT